MILQVPAKHALHLQITLNLHLCWVYQHFWGQAGLVREEGAAWQQVLACEETGWRSTDTFLGLMCSQLSLSTGETKESRTTTGYPHTALSNPEDDEFGESMRPPGHARLRQCRSAFLGRKNLIFLPHYSGCDEETGIS